METTAVEITARPRAEQRTRARAARWLWWLPLGASAALYAVFIGRTSFDIGGRAYFALFDDAMISMRYARNLVDGHGLVWNPGQYVEGYSNFLWTLWMAAIHVLPIPDSATSLAVMVSEAIVLLLGVVVVGRIARLIAPGSPLVPPVAMLLAGLYYPLVFWSLRGMEVGLASLLISLAALLALLLCEEWSARRCWALSAVLVAAVLTRDDLVVPAVIVVAFLAWRLRGESRRRTLAIVGGCAAIAVAGHELFRVLYYGDALPNTYYLKLSGISLATRLHRGIESLGSAIAYDLYAPLVLAAVAVARRWRSAARPAVALLAILFLAQCAYSVYVGGDAWEQVKFANRYVASVAPLLMVLAAIGIGELVARANHALAAATALAFGVAAVLVAHEVVPTHMLGFEPAGGLHAGRAVPALVLAALVVATTVVRRPFGAGGPVLAVAFAALVLVAVDGRPVRDWQRSNAQFLAIDRGLTGSGVALRDHTSPQAAVAVTAAGSVAYFDHRPGVDLLGKMDPVVAHEATRAAIFRPGHSKWDYSHSIGQLRPEVVTQLWNPTPRDYCDMAAWGYRQVAPRLYVRDPGHRVNVPGLVAALRAIGTETPYPTARACASAAP